MHKQLDIWLIAIGLTKKSQRYPSPLRSAYYSWFVGEPEITVGQKDRTPDIISTKPNDWLIIDLTLNPNKDLSLFYTDYSNLSSNILADIASPHYKSKSKYKPNLLVIASEQSFNKTKSNRANISGLIVLPKFRFIHNSNSLKDDDLIKELKKISGTPFKKPPTSILAVPEMNGKELKKPIKAVLLKYAVRKNNKFSEEEVLDNLLLGEKGFFSREARKKLSEKIKKVLLRLVSSLKENKKKEWISYNHRKGVFSLRYLSKVQSLSKFERLLEHWTNLIKDQERIDSYS